MKEYFKENENDFIEHFKEEFPYEGVGLIINDKYYRCENMAENPEEHFAIGATQYKKMRLIGDIQAVIHSHNDHPHVSEADMLSQMETLLPYCMVNLKNKAVNRIVWWGDTLEPQNLLNRYFVHGVYDCYGLLRDFFRHHDILIPNFSREVFWWEDDKALFEPNFEKAGFHTIYTEDLKPGDVVFMKIRGNRKNTFANHCAVYIGDGLIVHHLYNRASRIEPLSGWKRMITQCLRLDTFGNKQIKKELFDE